MIGQWCNAPNCWNKFLNVRKQWGNLSYRIIWILLHANIFWGFFWIVRPIGSICQYNNLVMFKMIIFTYFIVFDITWWGSKLTTGSVENPISLSKLSIISKETLFLMKNGPTTHGYLILVDFLKFKKCYVSTTKFCLMNSMENTLRVRKGGNL